MTLSRVSLLVFYVKSDCMQTRAAAESVREEDEGAVTSSRHDKQHSKGLHDLCALAIHCDDLLHNATCTSDRGVLMTMLPCEHGLGKGFERK
jgi:hypothetical protein